MYVDLKLWISRKLNRKRYICVTTLARKFRDLSTRHNDVQVVYINHASVVMCLFISFFPAGVCITCDYLND